MRKLFFGIFILVVCLFFISPASAWLSGYGYRQAHYINGSSSGALTNYDINFVVNNSTGVSTGNTIYTNGTLNPNWSDIRFTDTSDNIFPMWNENTSQTATSTTFTANFSSIVGGITNQTLMYIYYGNPAAANVSSGPATFSFFDHFDTASLNTTLWTDGSGNAYASSVITSTGANGYRGLTGKKTYAANYTMVAYGSMDLANQNGYSQELGWSDALTSTYAALYATDYPTTNTYNTYSRQTTGTGTNLGATYTGNHTWNITRNGTTSLIFSIDGTIVQEKTTQLPTETIPVIIESYSSGKTTKVNWIYVKPFAYTEPFHSTYNITEVNATAPVATFTKSVTYGNPAFSVQFTDTSTGFPTSWTWDFGDGQSDTVQNPLHIYTSWIGNTSISYNVSLNATNVMGSSISANQTVTAYPLTATMSSNITSGKPPLAVQFSSAYGNGTATNWSWDFGDTGTSTEQNPVHVYSSDGTYPVLLNASNAYSYNWSRNASMITVNPLTPPVANFTANTTSGNAPTTIQFWDNSTNTPTSWEWAWGDLTANGTTANPQHTYTVAGTYTVTLTATNADGSGTLQRVDYITIASGVIPFPGEVNVPTNPLGGTLYWDTNGNGRIDYNDLVIFFNYLAWAQANEPTWAFDFNSNGRLDYNDVQLLFGRL